MVEQVKIHFFLCYFLGLRGAFGLFSVHRFLPLPLSCSLFLCLVYLFAPLQGIPNEYDDVFMAVGSGGTASGIAIGNYLTGSKMK